MKFQFTAVQATQIAQNYIESEGQSWTALSPSAQEDEVARVIKYLNLASLVLSKVAAPTTTSTAVVAPAAAQNSLAKANALRAAHIARISAVRAGGSGIAPQTVVAPAAARK